jgi:hypothetical protein
LGSAKYFGRREVDKRRKCERTPNQDRRGVIAMDLMLDMGARAAWLGLGLGRVKTQERERED